MDQIKEIIQSINRRRALREKVQAHIEGKVHPEDLQKAVDAVLDYVERNPEILDKKGGA